VLVTLQLSAERLSNTVIPLNDPLYATTVQRREFPDDQILNCDKNYGFHPAMAR